MPQKSKLTNETLTKIKELVETGKNAHQISKIIGVTRWAIEKWAAESDIKMHKRKEFKHGPLKAGFKQLIESGKTLTEARKILGIGTGSAQEWANELGVRHLIRNRSQAAIQDKTLSFEEASKRIPEGQGVVIGFEEGKYIIKCEDGFVYRKTSAKLYQGDPRGKSGTKWTVDDVKSYLVSIGYEYNDGYKNSKKPFSAKHLKCGSFRETRLKLFKDQDCPVCSNNGVSKQETEIKNWILEMGFEAKKFKFSNNITRKKEIDIFIPSLNLGIEYCGLYWHSEESGKTRSYHANKMKEAKSEGVRLITIFEDEWLDRQDQVKNFLLSVLNKNEHKVYGRNTVVKITDKDTANKFYEDNHIQGRPQSAILHLGLYTKENLLVGCMSFGAHHRGGNDQTVVLNRLAFLHNHTVHGGASKLLSFAINSLKLMGYNKILSWSDSRWSEGNIYKTLGFSLEEELGPDYSYVLGQSRVSKQSCQKKNLRKKGAVGNTELEMAKSLGYSRIWDCGKIRWVLDI